MRLHSASLSADDHRIANGLRVLLVEDDDEDAFLVREHLGDVAPETDLVHVHTLHEALALAPEADCCLVDLGLPDATGLEAVERLGAGAPRSALVVLTGLHDTRRGLDAVAAGAQDYLVKGDVDGDAMWRAVRYAVERRRSEQTQRELTIANQLAAENRRLERGLLPRPVTSHPAVVLGSSYRAGRERALLGGDFFDAVEDDDGTLHLVIGDVSGHGPDEAALGVALRITWRALVLAGVRGDPLMDGLEEILRLERHDEDLFATLCSVCLQPTDRTAVIQLAGHPGPVLLCEDVPPRRLDAPAGLPLGVLQGTRRESAHVDLPERWGLVLHTDGLIEGVVGDDGERLGDDRLHAALLAELERRPDWLRDPQGLADALIRAVDEQITTELLDDTAVLIAGWTG
jgi:serine phosphatase RsbU (regulator of sigma subunit)